jgi:SAM-dependent methyltransferase
LDRKAPSWYLDPLVAAQKRRVHQDLVRRWTAGLPVRRALKTDVFEEAYGADRILFDLFPDATLSVGIDASWETVRSASAQCGNPAVAFAVCDVRRLALRAESVDVVVSTSTLDHFERREDIGVAIEEFFRVLRPGGVAVITLDNPWNPLYRPLRWACRRGWVSYRLGQTLSLPALVQRLEAAGFEVTATDTLIHNVRVLSTLLFLGLRRLLGRRADGPIRLLLALSAALGGLPTRRFSACFAAACARKPTAGRAGSATLAKSVAHLPAGP